MSSSLTCTKLTILTITGVTIQIIGLSLFVYGFFPVKPALSGVRYSYNPSILSAIKTISRFLFLSMLLRLRFSGAESFRALSCTPVPNQTDSDLPPHNLKSLYEVCFYVICINFYFYFYFLLMLLYLKIGGVC